MPPPTAVELPPPRDWQAFEDLCCDLWRELWGDPNTQKHGRQGQPQYGVDVFGQPERGEWCGIQCKQKSQLLGGTLTKSEVAKEVSAARGFNPRLSSFLIATTAPADVEIQRAAREISDAGPLAVSVWFWDEIGRQLAGFPDLVRKHYPDFFPGGHGTLRREYLSRLFARYNPLPALAIRSGSSGSQEAQLSAVYTALDVTASVGFEAGPGGRRGPGTGVGLVGVEPDYKAALLRRIEREAAAESGGRREARRRRERSEGYSRPLTALEAAAGVQRLVLLGPAGSGKSTFARHLALSLAGEELGRPEAHLRRLNRVDDAEAAPEPDLLPWPHGAVLPILVELRRFVRSGAFPADDETGEARQLLDFVLEDGAAEDERLALREILRQALLDQRGRALLILDGLDETPAAEASRGRLKHVVGSWVECYPSCRVLVTSRPYAYAPESPWRLDAAGFDETTLAPFDDEKVRDYVGGWYRHLAARGQIEGNQAQAQSADLVRRIGTTGYLRPLAERPLMLAMMADVHATGGGRLPGGRAALYERSVELLLDRWNEVRRVPEPRSAAQDLGMEVEEIRRALEELAYEVHRDRGAPEGEEGAEITGEELGRALRRHRRPPVERRVDEWEVSDYLHQRSGILFAESPTVYRFPHRSYQEYLAACYLLRKRFPTLLLEEVKADPALWREVALLAAGKAVAALPHVAWTILGGLVPPAPGDGLEADDPRFPRCLLAALALEESELWREAEEEEREVLERLRAWLVRTLELGALPPADRAAAGRVLGTLGDPRRGVGLDEEGLPDVAWVEIPAGKFLMGSTEEDAGPLDGKPQTELELAAFRIARYPVTNAQYGAFVEDGGYGERWRHCWTEEGWKWKGDREGPDDDLPAEFLLPSQPRVNVSWYEAVAFCSWLGERLGHVVRLPSEAEWEKAARGEDGRIYPWGEEWEEGRCNNVDAGIGRTCAVGMFPSGTSPYGVADMSGNVDEWCSTKWRDRYKKGAADDDLAGEASRVLRGGAFYSLLRDVRCAVRLGLPPYSADHDFGFRVSAPI